MKVFEYKKELIPNYKDLIEFLNSEGKNGWEAISIFPYEYSTQVIFKKEKRLSSEDEGFIFSEGEEWERGESLSLDCE